MSTINDIPLAIFSDIPDSQRLDEFRRVVFLFFVFTHHTNTSVPISATRRQRTIVSLSIILCGYPQSNCPAHANQPARRDCPYASSPEPAQANPKPWHLDPQGGIHSKGNAVRRSAPYRAVSGPVCSCAVPKSKPGRETGVRASRPIGAFQADVRGSTQGGRSQSRYPRPAPSVFWAGYAAAISIDYLSIYIFAVDGPDIKTRHHRQAVKLHVCPYIVPKASSGRRNRRWGIEAGQGIPRPTRVGDSTQSGRSRPRYSRPRRQSLAGVY